VPPNWNCCLKILPKDECGVPAPVEKKVEAEPELERNLKSVLEVRIAGDPDEQSVLFTDLSPRQIAQAVTDLGTPVSPPVVRNWLDDQGMALHKIAKVLEGGQSPDRDAQFIRIAQLKCEYAQAGNPVFSMDSKAKEHLGQLFRAGRVYTQRAFKAFDHDYPSWAAGVLIPHGIYDITRNRGHINIGLSHDTSEFACDSLRWYWNRIGQQCYPHATSILLLCDGGGSNSASHYIFKQDLQDLVNDLGIKIRLAHYPSYCSKYNPIERRFFSQVSRACTGMLFDSLKTAVGLMRKTSTTTGLKATVNVMHGLYEIKRKVAAGFTSNMKIVFDTLLPKWNYVAVPQ
jgi:Rhodopirellula transposase DDE domain